MPSPAPSLSSARAVEARLLHSLRTLDTARESAVLAFADILDRRLFLLLGSSSIHHYARSRLGFSRSRTAYFLRLARAFHSLPSLKSAVASGDLPWTKARELVRVATPSTEAAWIEQARGCGRRELVQSVDAAGGMARRRRRAPGQEELGLAEGSGGGGGNGAERAPVVEVPVDVAFRLSPEQFARLEALTEQARRHGVRGSREDLLLAAFEALAARGMRATDAAVAAPVAVESTREAASGAGTGETASGDLTGDAAGREHAGDPPSGARAGEITGNVPADRAATSPHDPASAPRTQIIVHQCETCGRASLPTSRGDLPVDPVILDTLRCDARIRRETGANRATVPPSLRRRALARDGHRCRTAGCGSTRFLDVHHVVPRERGGSNALANLLTLCSACHRLVHRMARRNGRGVEPPTRTIRAGSPG